VPAFVLGKGDRGAPAGRRGRPLLAYLASHLKEDLARDRPVELIWPRAAEGAGRASLHQSLSTIRKARGRRPAA